MSWARDVSKAGRNALLDKGVLQAWKEGDAARATRRDVDVPLTCCSENSPSLPLSLPLKLGLRPS